MRGKCGGLVGVLPRRKMRHVLRFIFLTRLKIEQAVAGGEDDGKGTTRAMGWDSRQ
jgi:hypothetical protein